MSHINGNSGLRQHFYAFVWAESSVFVLVWQRGNRATLG
jgi:hypothetical protein